jgi:hypothetical protein
MPATLIRTVAARVAVTARAPRRKPVSTTTCGEPAAGTGLDDLQDGELGRPAGGGVRAVRGDPLRHLVTLGELFFHDGVEIWEDAMNTGQPVPQARQAWRELTAGNVVHAGGGHELVGNHEIALVEDFLDQASRAELQVFRRHEAQPAAGRARATGRALPVHSPFRGYVSCRRSVSCCGSAGWRPA